MKFVFPLSVLMLLHILFVYMNVYSIPHLDSAMHFIGGIALGIFIFGVMGHAIRRGWCRDPGKIIMLVLIVSLVTTGAVCWEIYEWLSDAYLGTHFQLTLDDTLKDLVLGLAGGIVCTSMMLASGAYEMLSVQGDVQRKALKSGS